MSTEAVVRPNPFRWVLYCFGMRLPRRHSAWVLHDVSTPTWVLRHWVRACVQLAPICAALYLVIPGPVWVRAMSVLAGVLIGWFYSFAFMVESGEHRALKAGYPRGTARGIRLARTEDKREAQRKRYEERWNR